MTKLDKISDGVCDGSSSGAKSFREIVQASDKHKTAGVQKDVWHKEVIIMKKWGKLMKGKEQGIEELREKLPAVKLRRWFYTCATDCGEDGNVFQANWLGAANHYRTELQLSIAATSILYNFLLSSATDLPHYTRCRSTALVESLHGLSNKYTPKRLHYGIERFSARKGLAVLDWNENMSNEQNRTNKPSSHIKHNAKKRRHVYRKRTHRFRNVIRDKYLNLYRKH